MTPERVTMEPEEINNTETPEIHYMIFRLNPETRKQVPIKQRVLLRESRDGKNYKRIQQKKGTGANILVHFRKYD